MFITPMTADTVNDNFAANSTNYPALKIHIPFNEITGGTFLTDSIAGMVIPVDAATSLTRSANGGVTGIITGLASTTGTMPAPGSNSVLQIHAFRGVASTGTQLTVGATTTNGKGFRTSFNATNTGTVNNGGTAVNIVSTSAAAIDNTLDIVVAISLVFGSATGLVFYSYDGTTYISETPVSIATIASMPAIDNLFTMGTSGQNKLLSTYYFATLPSAAEIKAALAYTHYTVHTANKRTPYPGFRGRV